MGHGMGLSIEKIQKKFNVVSWVTECIRVYFYIIIFLAKDFIKSKNSLKINYFDYF